MLARYITLVSHLLYCNNVLRYIVGRIIGKKEMSNGSYTDFVNSISIVTSDLVQIIVLQMVVFSHQITARHHVIVNVSQGMTNKYPKQNSIIIA